MVIVRLDDRKFIMSTTQRGASYSNRSRAESSQSEIERIHSEATIVLTQKSQQMEQYINAIEEAEKELAQVSAQLEAKTKLFSLEDVQVSDSDDEDDIHGTEIEQLRIEQQEEIQLIKAKNEEEIQTLQLNFTKALKEAERWADEHADSIYHEKKAELDTLTAQLEELKASANEEAFNKTQTRQKLYHQSKSLSQQNSQRIQELDTQLSELSAITREELRDVKTKIDECFVAVEIREREHKYEIEKYENEVKNREQKYNLHLQALTDQFNNEKQRLEAQLVAANSKKENLDRVLKQLEKHHENQVQTAVSDLERMKSSIVQVQTREEQSFTQSKSQLTQTQAVQREAKQTEQEVILINQEILELQSQNRSLQAELKRLQNTLSNKSGKMKR